MKIFYFFVLISYNLFSSIVDLKYNSKNSNLTPYYRTINKEIAFDYEGNIQSNIKNGYIFVREKSLIKPEDNFCEDFFKEGDKISFNTDEKLLLKVQEDKKLFSFFRKEEKFCFPCLIKRGFVKITALCPEDVLKENEDKFIKIEKDNISNEELLNYSKNKDFTILYVFLPKDRKTSGYLKIKHKGKFLKDKSGKDVEFKVLGLSRQEYKNQSNRRLYPMSNVPQGIYVFYGLRRNDVVKKLGETEYLNIDRGFLPINRNADSNYILEQIVPRKSLDDYWLNEFNLANAFGRNAIRIHNNSLEKDDIFLTMEDGLVFGATNGCISVGERSTELISILEKLYVFNRDNSENNLIYDGYLNEDSIGKVFVLVKDF